jgi:hypothetical protein
MVVIIIYGTVHPVHTLQHTPHTSTPATSPNGKSEIMYQDIKHTHSQNE